MSENGEKKYASPSGEPGIFFITYLTNFSCWLEKVTKEDFGTEGEVFLLEIFNAFLKLLWQPFGTFQVPVLDLFFNHF